MRGLAKAFLGSDQDRQDYVIREVVRGAAAYKILCACGVVLDMGDTVAYQFTYTHGDVIKRARIVECGACFATTIPLVEARNRIAAQWAVTDVHDGRWFTKAGTRRAAFRNADLSDGSALRNPIPEIS